MIGWISLPEPQAARAACTSELQARGHLEHFQHHHESFHISTPQHLHPLHLLPNHI